MISKLKSNTYEFWGSRSPTTPTSNWGSGSSTTPTSNWGSGSSTTPTTPTIPFDSLDPPYYVTTQEDKAADALKNKLKQELVQLEQYKQTKETEYNTALQRGDAGSTVRELKAIFILADLDVYEHNTQILKIDYDINLIKKNWYIKTITNHTKQGGTLSKRYFDYFKTFNDLSKSTAVKYLDALKLRNAAKQNYVTSLKKDVSDIKMETDILKNEVQSSVGSTEFDDLIKEDEIGSPFYKTMPFIIGMIILILIIIIFIIYFSTKGSDKDSDEDNDDNNDYDDY